MDKIYFDDRIKLHQIKDLIDNVILNPNPYLINKLLKIQSFIINDIKKDVLPKSHQDKYIDLIKHPDKITDDEEDDVMSYDGTAGDDEDKTKLILPSGDETESSNLIEMLLSKYSSSKTTRRIKYDDEELYENQDLALYHIYRKNNLIDNYSKIRTKIIY